MECRLKTIGFGKNEQKCVVKRKKYGIVKLTMLQICGVEKKKEKDHHEKNKKSLVIAAGRCSGV